MTIALKREGADAFIPKQGIDQAFRGLNCPYCLNKFDDNDALRRHINRKHSEPDESIEDELQDEFGDDDE